jgi:hypothetical protein
MTLFRKVKKARRAVHKEFYAVDNKTYVESQLKAESLVLTEVCIYINIVINYSKLCFQNAFSSILGDSGFNIYQCVPNDLMHEIESGTWRAIFIHALRILVCVGEHAVQRLDWRYGEIMGLCLQ